jgi:hypothetical protein
MPTKVPTIDGVFGGGRVGAADARGAGGARGGGGGGAGRKGAGGTGFAFGGMARTVGSISLA